MISFTRGSGKFERAVCVEIRFVVEVPKESEPLWNKNAECRKEC